MSQPSPRYKIGRFDRITIDETWYGHVESDVNGHVLRRLDGSDLHEHVSHADYAKYVGTGRLRHDPNFFSPVGAELQQTNALPPLCTESRAAQERYLFRVDVVQRFREGYRLGRFTRSRKGWDKAAKSILADREQDWLEGIARHLKNANELKDEEDRIIDLLRSGGTRKGLKRHDSTDPSEYLLSTRRPKTRLGGRTLAAWVGSYERRDCDAASLRDRYSNSGTGSKLHPDVVKTIESSLATALTERRPSISFCYRSFLVAFDTENKARQERGDEPIKAPSRLTYSKYIKRIPVFVRVRSREGAEAAAARFSMSSGGVVARYPMQRLEIDEWTAHVHLIDGEIVPRSALAHLGKREYQTVRVVVAAVIDCATRYVLGLSFARTASPENVKAALRMALSDRSRIARAVGAETPWGPPAGLMEIFSDTGPSFDSSFHAAVADLGGTHVHGPAKKSELRPIIERWFRSVDQVLLGHYTGRAFSNIKELGAYPAQQRASATVQDFCWQMLRCVIDIQHNSAHDGLRGQTPHEAWQQAIRAFELPAPPDLHRLRVCLGRRFVRKTSGEGIYFCNVPYNSLRLQEYRRRFGDRDLAVMVDPNEINHISVELDDGWYELKSPGAVRLQGVSLLTWQNVCRDLRRHFQSQAALSQEIVFRALDAIRSANECAAILAGLGDLQPAASEIDRDEGKLVIGWNEPQLPPAAVSLSDGLLEEAEEFIPFTGTEGMVQADTNLKPQDETERAGRTSSSDDRGLRPSPSPTGESADWSEDE